LVSGRLKLIDFGIASKIQGDMTSVLKDVTTGTWNYMSPECIRSGGSNFEGHKVRLHAVSIIPIRNVKKN